MNERIQELIKQASYNIMETNGAPIISNEFNKEKFAELIVKSVMADLEKMREEYANPYGMYQPVEYYDRQAAKESAMEDALDTIRYNFGVSE